MSKDKTIYRASIKDFNSILIAKDNSYAIDLMTGEEIEVAKKAVIILSPLFGVEIDKNKPRVRVKLREMITAQLVGTCEICLILNSFKK
jgi:hypothetical protein